MCIRNIVMFRYFCIVYVSTHCLSVAHSTCHNILQGPGSLVKKPMGIVPTDFGFLPNKQALWPLSLWYFNVLFEKIILAFEHHFKDL